VWCCAFQPQLDSEGKCRGPFLPNFEAHWPGTQAIDPIVFTERFRRVWNYYLCGLIEGFRPGGGNLNLHHITLSKGKGHYPRDRRFMYVGN